MNRQNRTRDVKPMYHMYTCLERIVRSRNSANKEIQTLFLNTSFVGATLPTQFLIERSPPQRPQSSNTVVGVEEDRESSSSSAIARSFDSL